MKQQVVDAAEPKERETEGENSQSRPRHYPWLEKALKLAGLGADGSFRVHGCVTFDGPVSLCERRSPMFAFLDYRRRVILCGS